jgi:hypothetical protein
MVLGCKGIFEKRLNKSSTGKSGDKIQYRKKRLVAVSQNSEK